MSHPTTPTLDDSWKDRSYQELMDETICLELKHKGLPDSEAETVRAKFEDLVLTCSFLSKPGFTEFSDFYRDMCVNSKFHPLSLEPFLRAAWKACDDDAKGLRPIPRKAEIEAQARDFRREHILDTELSWAYEGLDVKFRSDLEEGEDPAEVAKSYAKPNHLNREEIREGMREYIDSGGLEAWNAKVAADFEKQQTDLA